MKDLQRLQVNFSNEIVSQLQINKKNEWTNHNNSIHVMTQAHLIERLRDFFFRFLKEAINSPLPIVRWWKKKYQKILFADNSHRHNCDAEDDDIKNKIIEFHHLSVRREFSNNKILNNLTWCGWWWWRRVYRIIIRQYFHNFLAGSTHLINPSCSPISLLWNSSIHLTLYSRWLSWW